VVIHAGRVVADGSPRLLTATARQTVIRFCLPIGLGLESLPSRVRESADVEGTQIVVRTPDPIAVLHELTGWAMAEHHPLDDLTVERRSLEDTYLDLVSEVIDRELT
jgi:ABC-2 type transport system ATP-binding protein